MLVWLITAMLPAYPASAQDIRDVAASEPTDLSVTIYRNPDRDGGAIELGSLGGFAVIVETRTVQLPAGTSRLRFEGVVDGIIPASAIVTGLPGGVIEKNRDAALLSPSSLLRAARGRTLTLTRTDPASGKQVQVPAELVSASEDGVVFKTASGTESLRCSGFPETFSYSVGAEGLSARPTLSVLTTSDKPVTATVTLTYIAEGFDWNASYAAQVSPDGKTMDIGAWVTLANENSVSLTNARTQIVAGGLNREYVDRYVNDQPQVVARCWPAQRTHEIPLKPDQPYVLVRPWQPGESIEAGFYAEEDGAIVVTAQRRSAKLQETPVAVTAVAAESLEQLGDLKLYRVPQPTTVGAMQMKQVRLMEQPGVPFDKIYAWSLYPYPYAQAEQRGAAQVLLRTRNDKKHHLGLPLPAGTFTIQQEHSGLLMLIAEPNLGDTAEDEKVELVAGTAPDVSVLQRRVNRDGDKALDYEFEVTNAGPDPVTFELKIDTDEGWKISGASAKSIRRDGRTVFVLRIAAGSTAKLRFTASAQ